MKKKKERLEMPVPDESKLPEPRSDAVILFGVTGDLAYKKIFPALYAMVKKGWLDVPVVGVASTHWNLTQLKDRATQAITSSGKIDDPDALNRLLSLLQYVAGDYNDTGTFYRLKEALGPAKQPVYYLAIPPTLFETVIRNLGATGLAHNARVIVEKPFGGISLPRASSTGLRDRYFPRTPFFASITSSARKRS